MNWAHCFISFEFSSLNFIIIYSTISSTYMNKLSGTWKRMLVSKTFNVCSNNSRVRYVLQTSFSSTSASFYSKNTSLIDFSLPLMKLVMLHMQSDCTWLSQLGSARGSTTSNWSFYLIAEMVFKRLHIWTWIPISSQSLRLQALDAADKLIMSQVISLINSFV